MAEGPVRRSPEAARAAPARTTPDLERAERLGHRHGGYRIGEPPADPDATPGRGDRRRPGPAERLGAAPAEQVQRDVGFEIEMLVAADIDGEDAPEKVTHYDKDGLELTIDHGGSPIRNATRAIKDKAERVLGEGKSPTDEYHSILEIVTRHEDVATAEGKEATLTMMAKAVELANTIFAGTNGLTERKPLQSILSTSSALHVSLDIAKWQIAQAQTLDASIQASVGVDLAQVPAFFGQVGGLGRSRLAETEMDHAASLAEAAKVGPKILHGLRSMALRAGLGRTLAKGQNFVNLEGLFTTIALYLVAGKRAVVGTGSVWKNFTPLLSRVDLSTLYKTSTTPEERELVESENALSNLVEMILGETGRGHYEPLLLGIIPYGEAQYALPSCGQFVTNVLSGQPDGVMSVLEEAEDFDPLQPESVGPQRVSDDLTTEKGGGKPADRRRQAEIFEIRTLKKRALESQVSQLASTRFDPGSWSAMADEIIDLVQGLNRVAFGVEEETQEEIELRQEWEDYMRSRDDEI